MSRFGHRNAGQEDPGDVLRDAIRQEFSRQIERQRDKIPSAKSILLVAQFEAKVRRNTRADALLAWASPLLFCTIAGLLAFWWSRISATKLDLADITEPWIQATALAALLSAMALGWTHKLLRTG